MPAESKYHIRYMCDTMMQELKTMGPMGSGPQVQEEFDIPPFVLHFSAQKFIPNQSQQYHVWGFKVSGGDRLDGRSFHFTVEGDGNGETKRIHVTADENTGNVMRRDGALTNGHLFLNVINPWETFVGDEQLRRIAPYVEPLESVKHAGGKYSRAKVENSDPLLMPLAPAVCAFINRIFQIRHAA